MPNQECMQFVCHMFSQLWWETLTTTSKDLFHGMGISFVQHPAKLSSLDQYAPIIDQSLPSHSKSAKLQKDNTVTTSSTSCISQVEGVDISWNVSWYSITFWCEFFRRCEKGNVQRRVQLQPSRCCNFYRWPCSLGLTRVQQQVKG